MGTSQTPIGSCLMIMAMTVKKLEIGVTIFSTQSPQAISNENTAYQETLPSRFWQIQQIPQSLSSLTL
jgi:hypothetical protein